MFWPILQLALTRNGVGREQSVFAHRHLYLADHTDDGGGLDPVGGHRVRRLVPSE